MNAEFNRLLPKRLTVLEIRDFLSGEFTPLPLADLMAVRRVKRPAASSSSRSPELNSPNNHSVLMAVSGLTDAALRAGR